MCSSRSFLKGVLECVIILLILRYIEVEGIYLL